MKCRDVSASCFIQIWVFNTLCQENTASGYGYNAIFKAHSVIFHLSPKTVCSVADGE